MVFELVVDIKGGHEVHRSLSDGMKTATNLSKTFKQRLKKFKEGINNTENTTKGTDGQT